MPSDALFQQVMNSGLRAWLNDVGEDRTKAVTQAAQRKALAGVGAALAGVVVAVFSRDLFFAGFAAFGAFGVAWSWADAPVRRIKAAIKEQANGALASAMGASYRHEGEPGVDYGVAERFGLVPSDPDEADYSDFWEGSFGGIDLAVHEAHLQEWQGSGKSRRLVTVFRGVVMGYRFARGFHGTTLVRRDSGVLNFLGGGAGSAGGARLERVRMVDPRFEKLFEVHSTDQVEARYLVHPAFCERLLDVETAFHGKRLRLVFSEGRVVLVVETDDLFESGGIDSEGDEARLRDTIEQIGSLLDLARALNERERG